MPKKTVFCKTMQAAQAKFAPLTLDFTFKRAFANEQCKDLLLFMLNTFLRKALREPIRDVKIIHTVQLGKTIKSRGKNLHPEVRYDIVRMVYVRLALFGKSEKECQNDLDRLLFAFKNAHKLSKKPASFNSSQFKRLFEIAKISNFNGEEFMSYEREMKHFSDHMNALAYAKKKGVNEGIAKGITQGVTKGIAQGITQGILQAAKSMLKDGLSPARVARITRLPKEKVLALR